MAQPLAPGALALERSLDFEALVRTEQKRLYLLCRRMLQDADDADMATQDVFLKAFRALKQQGGAAIDDPSKWLTRIAVNVCLDRLRSRSWQFWRRRPKPEDEQMILRLQPSAAPSAEDEARGREIGRRLAAALEKLSARQRAVFTLRHYEECSLEEIGAALGLDVGTVKAHLSRALVKLRLELRDLYGARCADGGES
ncbi:MAG: RNA polymerase sigma factor [Bryobacteraceae bacterium]